MDHDRTHRRYPMELVVAEGDLPEQAARLVRRRLAADPAHVAKLFRQKRVLFVAGEAAEPRTLQPSDQLADPGTLLLLAAPARARSGPQPNKKIRLRVVHEDEAVIVLDKPAGVAVHQGPRHGTDTLLNGLAARYPELAALGAECDYGLVHRLDLETSGLMVVARAADAHEALVRAFAAREVEKEYEALVDARRTKPDAMVIESDVAGKSARTEVEVLEVAGEVARLLCRPRTGRTHQIRVHLAERGLPVLADARYGAGRDDLTARFFVKRLALHARSLAFAHPRSGARLAFELPLPRDLRHAWRRATALAGGDLDE